MLFWAFVSILTYKYILSLLYQLMKNVFSHVHHHIKHHHKKYLFGLFGGFAVVKVFLLLLGFSALEYANTSTFAQLATGCVTTWSYYTWEYETGWYLTGQELTWWELTGCITIPWYRTGGALDESGVLTWEIRIDEILTWCELTGQVLGEWYTTWWYLTWGYRTWETIVCDEEIETGNVLTWWNGICESGDIVWNGPLSWSFVSNIFPITWSYSWSDCVSGLSLQLRDHNNQRVNLSAISSWATWYNFDSSRLYNFQHSWFYTIYGNTGAGNFTVYSWTYSGTYSRFFTWYKLRLFSQNQSWVYETSPFTIDNQTPTLTGITLLSSWSSTGYINVSGGVVLSFIANKELTWLEITLWSNKIATSSSISWLVYTYTRNLTSLYTEGPVVATIPYADRAWNTGLLVYTSALVLDMTRPVVAGLLFSGYASWVYLNFTWSESIRYTFDYIKAWWTLVTGANPSYLTAHQLNFSWIERSQIYTFHLNTFDRAGNSRLLTGDVLRTTSWMVVSHIYFVPWTSAVVLSWSLTTLGSTLKNEIDKFNICKAWLSYTPVELKIRNTIFTLQMPSFKSTQIKTLVNAFTLFVLDKIIHNYSLTPANMDEITKKFNNFLIVLKLLRDDDNNCRQNLSSYYVNQFKKSLEEYKISL